MNAVVEIASKEPQLPAPVARRNISEAAWRTAMNSLFPGAKAESVIMVFDYCAARKLDPLKKPCHIVPMQVKDAQSGQYVWRDVVMPGIYEYRTTATRTGLYLGHSKPTYGEVKEIAGVMVPEWCALTVKRWNPQAELIAEYPVEIYFSEVVATKNEKANSRWSKAPRQMLTKCTEAAALREAFPDELGGTHTADEMDGHHIELDPEAGNGGINPRGDLSGVDFEMRDKHITSIVDILNCDKEASEICDLLNEYVNEHLNPFPELYTTVTDELAKRKIISKANWRKYLDMNKTGERQHG